MILKKVTTTEVPAIKRFVAADHFKGDGFYLLSNFKDNFLPKIESATKKEVIRVSELTEYANGEKILGELGANPEVTLGQLFELLKSADKSEYYIAYVKDVKGEVWAVRCYWRSDLRCWYVEAFPITRQDGWGAGRQVFSKDIVAETTTKLTLKNGEKTLVSHEDYDFLSRFDWHLDSHGYAVRGITRDGKKQKEFLHRVVLERKLGELSTESYIGR